MNSQFLFENIFDLTVYPIRNPNFSFSTPYHVLGKPSIIDGDLHANPLRLWLNYAYHGIIDPTVEEHDLFVRLYYMDIEKWRKEEIEQLEKLSHHVKKNIINMMNMLLIGDEVYDRGKLDLFVVLLIMFPVLLSNHGAEFISCVEQACFDDEVAFQKKLSDDPIYLDRYSPDHRRSSLNMQKLMDRGIISKEKVKALVNQYYLPQLKLIEFSISADEKITVFTHAPSGHKMWEKLYYQFETALINVGDENKIKALREQLGITKIKSYDSESFSLREEIAKLKYLNELFNLIKERKLIHQLLAKKYDEQGQLIRNPLADFLWNRIRDPQFLGRDFKHFNYSNGHDPKENDTKGVYELDCLLAKNEFITEGKYNLLYSYEMFGNEIDQYLSGKKVYQTEINSKWHATKEMIIKSFSEEDFIIKNTEDGAEKILISGADFLTKALDSQWIFSDYRINSLQYLLIEEKEAFKTLFKQENNKDYDINAIQSLNHIINKNEIHTLLDIIFVLMHDDKFKKQEKIILQKVLSLAYHKNFLDRFYKLLLLMNEYKKHDLSVDVSNIYQLLNHPHSDVFLTLYSIHLQENLLHSIKGCTNVDYLKLFSVYKNEGRLKDICWMIKMIDLLCTDWKTSQKEKAEISQKLVDFMCHPQFMEMAFQIKLTRFQMSLPIIPKQYLNFVFSMMMAGTDKISDFNRFIDLITGLQFKDGWPKLDNLSSVIDLLNIYSEIYSEKINEDALVNLLDADEERMKGFVRLIRPALIDKENLNLINWIFSDGQIMRRFLTIIDTVKICSPSEVSLQALNALIRVEDNKFRRLMSLIESEKNQNDLTISNLIFSNAHAMEWLTKRCILIPSMTIRNEAQLKLIMRACRSIITNIVSMHRASIPHDQINSIMEKLNHLTDIDHPKERMDLHFGCVATIFSYVSSLFIKAKNAEERHILIERLSDDAFFKGAKLLEKSKAAEIINLLKQHFEGRRTQNGNSNDASNNLAVSSSLFGQQQNNQALGNNYNANGNNVTPDGQSNDHSNDQSNFNKSKPS